MDNKYINRSKITEAKFRQLVRLFALDLTATQIAELSNLNRNTINRYIKGIRERVAEYCYIMKPVCLRDYPEVEITDAAQAKVIGIKEGGGAIHIIHFDEERVQEIQSLLRVGLAGENKEEVFPGIDVIAELGTGSRLRLCDGSDRKYEIRDKINRIEGFIGYSQTRLEKFKGMHGSTHALHLKECELRYNTKSEELYSLILKIIRNKPLF